MTIQTLKNKWRIYIAVFFIVNMLLASWFIDLWPMANSYSRALPVLTFSEDRTLKIDKYADLTIDKSKVGEHFYSDKAPLPTLCMIPFYELMRLCGFDKIINDTGRKYPLYTHCRIRILYGDAEIYSFPKIIPVLIAGGIIFGSLPFVLTVLMSFIALHKIKPSVSAVFMAMLAWYGSFIFVFTGAFFNHVLAGFLLLLSFVLLTKNRYFLSGLALGFGFLTEYTVIAAAPFWLICILIKERKTRGPLTFVAGIVPSIFFIAIYNWLITGHPWTMLNAYHAYPQFNGLHHHYGFSHPSLKAIWGLAFSLKTGFFNYAPVFYGIAFYMIASLIKNRKLLLPAETKCLAFFGIIFFLIISSFFTWWGGMSYGPRYLIVLAIPLLYEGLLIIPGNKTGITILTVTALLGIAGAWMAKATLVYLLPTYPEMEFLGIDNPFSRILGAALSMGEFNPNNILTIFFDISPKTGVLGWLFAYAISLAGLCLLYRKWFSEKTV